MSSLFFWSVNFTLDDIYKVTTVFIVVLDRTTGQYNIEERDMLGRHHPMPSPLLDPSPSIPRNLINNISISISPNNANVINHP